MGRLSSQLRARTRIVFSSIQHRTAGRWWYKVGFSLLTVSLIAATKFDSLSEARAAIRHYATYARLDSQTTPPDSLILFGPTQYVTTTSNIQVNFVASVPTQNATPPDTSTWATNPRTFKILLKRVGGSLTTATVAVNGIQVATAADFSGTTSIERAVSLVGPNSTIPITLSLKGAAGAGLTATVLGTPNPAFNVFGPKVYTKTATTPTHFVESFTPVGASAPFVMTATASIAGTKACITLNGVQVIKDIDFGTYVTTVTKTVNLVSGSNAMVVDVRGTTGKTITLTLTALDKTPPTLTIEAPSPTFVTSASTVTVSGTSQDREQTQVKVNGIVGTMSGDHFTQYSVNVPLTEGTNTLAIRATDKAGNHTDSTRTVKRDSQAPTLTVTSPIDNSFTNQNTVTVAGSVTDATTTTVKVNGVDFPVGQAGAFTGSYTLAAGPNFITIAATDAGGNVTSVVRKVTQAKQPPVITVTAPTPLFFTKATPLAVSGTVTGTTPITVSANGVAMTVGGSSFSGNIPLVEGQNEITFTATDPATNQTIVHQSGKLDTQAPVLVLTSPADGSYSNATTTTVSGTATDANPVTVTVNGVNAPLAADGSFTATVALPTEGANAITVVATDAATNQATASRNVIRDTQPPALSIASPADNLVTRTSSVSIIGNAVDASPITVSVNSLPLIIDLTGAVSGSGTLVEGANTLTFVVTDAAGNTASQVRNVTLDTQAPVITISEPADGASIATQSVVTTGSVADASATTLTVNGAAIAIGAGGAFSGEVPLTTGLNPLSYVATDAAGNVASASRTVTRQAAGPPNPVAVATPVNKAEVTLMQENTAFLYAGANPVQTGVATGTIAFLRAAVVRGKVLDVALAPLADVAVTIKDHPELGRTTTRSDGAYDLAVNGGGTLVLDFSKATYLPAQRNVAVPWQDYTTVDSVIMLQPDPVKTIVDLTSTEITVARASVQTDADGPRQATVFFEPGTQATLRHADGTTEVLTTLDIRATEFTVGANGGAAMPGDLPPSSQYTYAVQVTADQQLAAGPGAVLTFSQPVPLYVENFLDFPVGTKVPLGVYNPAVGAWQPRPNGVVLKILGTDAQGRALLDINGDGVADSDSLLVFNGIDPLERIKLAGTYPAGSALWRVFIIESLPHDLNWPYVILGGEAPHSKVTGPCGSEGADVLRCSLQVQTAFQSVGIVGSPFTLNYASDRTQGNVADRQLDLKLVGDTVPSFLERVDVDIDIAGRRFEVSFTPTRNLAYTFVWDGKDAYGRTVQATQPAIVRISYMYPVLYGVPAPGDASFGLPCMSLTGACPLAGDIRESIRALRRVAEIVTTTLGAFDATGAGLGGFTLNVQNTYDPIGGQFYAGDGTRRVAATLPEQVTRWAGTGSAGTGGTQILNNVPKTQSVVSDPAGIVVAPDGTVYFVDRGRSRIRKVSPDGIITTVAGTGVSDFNGDDRLATTASLTNPWGLALGPDGSLYFGEQVFRSSIRRIGPDGFIRAVAGNGTCGFAGDGGPAIAARVCNVSGMGFAPDGSLYFADTQNNRIRKIGIDGIIRTVAGTGATCFTPGADAAPAGLFESQCGEGIPATQALLRLPTGLTVGPDGMVYFAQQAGGAFQSRIRRIDPAGFIYVFAGGDVPPTQLNEGGSAKKARLGGLPFPGMTVGPDGSVYFSSDALGIPPELYVRVRRVRPDGRITTVAGDGTQGSPSGDNGPARRAQVGRVEGLAITAAGDLLMSDDAEVRLVSAPLPGLAAGQSVIASTDGSELYVFSSAGRQLLTLRQLTGDTIYRFSYNNARQLVSVRDRHGLTTEIQRDGTGKVTGVLSPDGYHTSLVLGPNGELQGVTDPSGNTAKLAYGDDGLALSGSDPNGSASGYAFDSTGRLTRVTDPDGEFLSRNLTGPSTVTMTSSSGSAVSVGAQRDSTGTITQTGTLPSGTAVQSTTTLENTTVTHAPDGTTYTITRTPDPRFGMQVPLEQVVTRLPSGLQRSDLHRRTVVLSDTQNLLSLTTQIDSIIKNGRSEVQTYDQALRRLTTLTRAGRVDFSFFDSVGNQVRDSVSGVLARRYTFDAGGRLVQVTQGAHTVRAFLGSTGLKDSTSDELGRKTHWQYDAAGHDAQRVRPGADTLRWEHDSAGRTTAIIPPSRPAHRFTYNFRGAMESYQPPPVASESSKVLWRYTDGGQPSQMLGPDGKNVSWGYDASGRRTITAFGNDTIRVSYNPVTGQPASFTGPEGQSVAEVADGGLVTQRSWSGPVSGIVKAQFDSNFRVSSLLVNGSPVTSYGYDLDGAITSAGGLSLARDPLNGLMTGTTLGQVTTSLGRNGNGEDSVAVTQFGSTILTRWVYGRDPTGRVTSVNETIDGVVSNLAYAFDSTGRLNSVTKDGSLAASYEYDKNGNRLRAVSSSGIQQGAYDVQDRLISYGAAEYRQSPAGNVAEKIVGTDTTKYSFDALSELRSVRLPNGTVISYLYDGNGRRVGKRVNGAFVQGFLYSGNLHPIAELDASGAVIRQFVYASRQDVPDFLIQGGTTYRIVADAAGSVRLVVDSQTGAIAQRIDYDAFGRVISNSAPGFQPLGFGGGFSDTETGLVHLGLRFYDPETGRWISRDPILFDGGSSNLYTYAGSDPVNRADRTGTFIGALITELAMDETIEESQHTNEIKRLKTVLNVAAACVNGYVDAWSKKTGMDYEHGGQNCHEGVISELSWDIVENTIGFENHSRAWQIAYSCMFGAVSDAYVPMVIEKSDDHAGLELAWACIGGGAGQGLEYVKYSHHPIIGPIVGALANVMFHVTEKFAEAEMDK